MLQDIVQKTLQKRPQTPLEKIVQKTLETREWSLDEYIKQSYQGGFDTGFELRKAPEPTSLLGKIGKFAKEKIQEPITSFLTQMSPREREAAKLGAIPSSKVRLPFQKEPTVVGQPLELPVVTAPLAISGYLLEVIPKTTYQFVQNVREIWAKGEAEPLKTPFDARRLGFDKPEIESSGRKAWNRFNELNAENPPEDELGLWKNAALASLQTIVPDSFDAFIAGNVAEMGSNMILKATKYDPMLERSLSELGMSSKEKFTVEEFIKRVDKSVSHSLKHGTINDYVNTLQAAEYVWSQNMMVGGTTAQLTPFFQKLQNVAKNLTLPIQQMGKGFQMRPIAPPTALTTPTGQVYAGYPVSDEIKKQIINLSKKGLTPEVIAKQFGITKPIVDSVIGIAGKDMLAKQITPEAQKGVVEAVKPEISPRLRIEPIIPPDTPLSKHFERTKESFDALAEGVGFDEVKIENQAKRAFDLVERSPNEALKVAYGFKEPPKGLYKEAVQISMIDSLKAAGRIDEATTMARKLTLEFTKSAQQLNLAKLDVSSAGERRIEALILDEKLAQIGKSIPKGIQELEPKQRALSKIRADTQKIIRESFDSSVVGKAEGLLGEIKMTDFARTELAKGFTKDNVSIQKLYNMTSAQRRDLLSKYVSPEEAKQLSAGFERALLSNQKQALSNWVWKNMYGGKSLYNEVELGQAKKMFDAGLRASNLKKLSSEGRIANLSKYVGVKDAEKLNTRFEKAQRSGTLANWEERTIGSKDLFENQKLNRMLKRLEQLDQLGVLTPAQATDFMEDFLFMKLGIDITPEQAKVISKFTKELSTAWDNFGGNMHHTNKKNIVAYFDKRREIEDFIKKVAPNTAWDIFTSVGARGSILMSLRVPMNSLIFQIVPGIVRSVAKRIISPMVVPGDYKWIDRIHATLSGLPQTLVPTEFWREQTKMTIEIYKRTGYDVSRMQTLEDGFRYFGEKYTNPTGPTWGESKGVAEKMGAVVRGHARLVSPALKYGAGGTDVIFAAGHRAGTSQILANQIARIEKITNTLPKGMTTEQRVDELIKEGLSFNPQSVQGQYIREMGILDANHANFTQNDIYGKFALYLRDALPRGLGSTIAPFAKIPANALGESFEATGPGTIMGAKRVFAATKMPPGVDQSVETAEGLTQMIAAAGLLGAAIFITSMLDNDDFIGAYDYAKRSENQLTLTKNAGANYVRIGGKWWNLRWWGPLSLPITAIMTGRKNRAEGKSFMIGYAQGVVSGILEFPVLKEFFGVLDSLTRASTSGTTSSFFKNVGLDVESIRKWLQVRVIPSIISHDVLGLFDETRYDAFGRPIPEKTFKNFIIGANIKEDTSNMITEEFDRLKDRGHLPVLTNPSGLPVEFLEFVAMKVDDKMYLDFLNERKQDYAWEVYQLIQTDKYKELPAEEQKSKIDAIRRKEILDPVKERADQLMKELDMENITSEQIEREIVAHKYGKTISDYAAAFAVDPGNAFKALLTKEKLGVVEGNLVELQRFYGIHFEDAGGSQEYKRTLMNQMGIPWDDRENWKLEHITPVKAGGDNSDKNLMIVDKALHDFFTPIDIAVGNAVKDGRITRKEATKLMVDFKVKRLLTSEEVIEAIR